MIWLQAAEEELQKEEAQIKEQNDAFEKGEATFNEKVIKDLDLDLDHIYYWFSWSDFRCIPSLTWAGRSS